jgi:hypothetical protein
MSEKLIVYLVTLHAVFIANRTRSYMLIRLKFLNLQTTWVLYG